MSTIFRKLQVSLTIILPEFPWLLGAIHKEHRTVFQHMKRLEVGEKKALGRGKKLAKAVCISMSALKITHAVSMPSPTFHFPGSTPSPGRQLQRRPSGTRPAGHMEPAELSTSAGQFPPWMLFQRVEGALCGETGA